MPRAKGKNWGNLEHWGHSGNSCGSRDTSQHIKET